MALTPEFQQKVEAIEQRLRMAPGSLLAVMRFETGGTFDPAEKNRAGSGATGLIQFMPSTAKSLGTSTDALAKMSAEDQMEYVEKYFQPYKGKLGTLKDAYMAVLYPKAIGKPEWYPLFSSGTKAYEQNAGLDRDKKGMVTVGDAVARVQQTSGEEAPATLTAQAPRREGATATTLPASQRALMAEAVPEPAALEPGGTDWASLLFAETGTDAAGGGSPGGTDWSAVLFS
jgi:hypothetical protein